VIIAPFFSFPDKLPTRCDWLRRALRHGRESHIKDLFRDCIESKR
jgi:hypothetical protein